MEKHMAVCPYCGAGCKMNLMVENGRVIDAEGLPGVTNEGELCLKGLYGYDFVNDTRILTPRIYHPMIRRTKGAPLERVSWDEALDFTASRLRAIIEESGPEAVMLTGSSRGAGNEANFVMQKFTRACLGTNNIDNCARTCHAASVIGLMECVGSGAMSVSIPTLEETDCILLIGYNPAASHPIVARRIVRAKERGAELIVCDPRVIESARIADLYLPLANGSNLALVNALAYTIIDEELADFDFIDEHTEGFDDWWEIVQDYAPEDVEGVCGLSAELIRQAARRYATAETAVVGWGMGVTQHAQGVQTVRAIAALALITGHIGKPRSGLAPVRGQNNVQGSCDMGMWPSLYPGYQRVDDPAARAKFAAAWGVPEERLSLEPGWKLTDLPHAVEEGKIRAGVLLGANAMMWPQTPLYQEAIKNMEFTVAIDYYMRPWTHDYVDMLLPAAMCYERMAPIAVFGRKIFLREPVVEPAGQAREDWRILLELGCALGFEEECFGGSVEAALEDMMAGSGLGITLADLREHPEGYDVPGEPTEPRHYETGGLRKDGEPGFNTPTGKIELVSTVLEQYGFEGLPVYEEPVYSPVSTPELAMDYPLVLNSGGRVPYYTHSKLRDLPWLNQFMPEPVVRLHPKDAEARGIADGDPVRVFNQFGEVAMKAELSNIVLPGAVDVIHGWQQADINLLTSRDFCPITGFPPFRSGLCEVAKA